MNLSEFIKCTLTEISSGIESSQEELKKKGVIVFPSVAKDNKAEVGGYVKSISVVSFEVELSDVAQDGNGWSIGVNLPIVSAEAKSNGKEKKTGTKISFDVPVVFSQIDVKAPIKTPKRIGIP